MNSIPTNRQFYVQKKNNAASLNFDRLKCYFSPLCGARAERRPQCARRLRLAVVASSSRETEKRRCAAQVKTRADRIVWNGLRTQFFVPTIKSNKLEILRTDLLSVFIRKNCDMSLASCLQPLKSLFRLRNASIWKNRPLRTIIRKKNFLSRKWDFT